MLLNLMQGGELPRIMGPVHRGHVFSRAPDQWHFSPDDNACSHSRFTLHFYSYSSIFLFAYFCRSLFFQHQNWCAPPQSAHVYITYKLHGPNLCSKRFDSGTIHFSSLIESIKQECISRKSRYWLKKWSGSVPPCCIVLPCPSWAHSSHCPGSDGVSQRNWITNCSR